MPLVPRVRAGRGGPAGASVTGVTVVDTDPVVLRFTLSDSTYRDVTIPFTVPSGGGGSVTSGQITDATTLGRAILTAANAAAAKAGLDIVATDIEDSTAIGRSLLTAADQAAVQTIVGATGGGGFTGDADDIPDGSGKVIMTTAEREKLTALPAAADIPRMVVYPTTGSVPRPHTLAAPVLWYLLSPTNLPAENTTGTGTVGAYPQDWVFVPAEVVDPDETEPSLVVTATPGNGIATLHWSITPGSGGALPTGIWVGRDGVDSTGSGPWNTVDPIGTLTAGKYVGSRVFNGLLNGQAYTLTGRLMGITGDVSDTVLVTPTGTTDPGDPVGGAWLSGAASQEAADGRFGTWRGRAVDIGGTWINDASMPTMQPGAEWGSFTGAMDVGLNPPDWQGWAAEAAGVHDAFFRQAFRTLRTLRAGRGTTFVRCWYEFNGNWMTYSAYAGDVANFKAAYTRTAQIFRTEFPEGKFMLGVSASRNSGVDVASYWPADMTLVDALSVDVYNNYPHVTTQAAFDSKIASAAGVNSLEPLRQLAAAKGVPVVISEWGNQGKVNSAANGGGGESPQFMTSMYNWLSTHGGTGPGKVRAEVYFNLWDDQFTLMRGTAATSLQPLTAQRYRDLW